MFRSQLLFPYGERTGVQRLRLLERALVVIQQSEIVGCRGDARVVGADLLSPAESALQELLSLGIVRRFPGLHTVSEQLPPSIRLISPAPINAAQSHADHQCHE